MSTLFPAGLDAFTTKVDSVDDVLAADTNNLQDAVSALQAKVGVNGSAVPTTLDRRLAVVEAIPRPIGVGQTWQSVSRILDTNYQNTTGRSILLCVTFQGRTGSVSVGVNTSSYVQASGNTSSISNDTNARPIHSIVIPPGHYYRISGSSAINNVKELR